MYHTLISINAIKKRHNIKVHLALAMKIYIEDKIGCLGMQMENGFVRFNEVDLV